MKILEKFIFEYYLDILEIKKTIYIFFVKNISVLGNKRSTNKPDITCEKQKQKEKYSWKEIATSQRKIDIAKGKGGKLWDFLKDEPMESNMLYDGDIMVKHENSNIIEGIRNFLPEQSILYDLGGAKMGNTCILHHQLHGCSKINSKTVFCQKFQRFAWQCHL